MKRSQINLKMAVLLGLMTAGCVQTKQQDQLTQAKETERPPNVIYFLADDLGVGDLASYGQQKIRTPNIDRLASEGMRFTRHYSGSSVCAPSRASLMTGKDMGHTGVRGNYQQKNVPATAEYQGQYPLSQGATTLAHLFQQAGYRTGAFGKWGLGASQSSGAPTAMGFDEFYGYLDQRQAHNYFPRFLWQNHQQVWLNNPVINVHPKARKGSNDHKEYMGEDYAPYKIVAKAKAFIRKNQGEPFFLYVPFVVPHAAMQIPDAELEAYAFTETPHVIGGARAYTPHPKPRAARAAMISRMDRDVGDMMTLLEELGLDDNTLVFFSSDNGATTAGGSDIKFFNSTAGLRGEKGTLYEGGIRAPLIARWPSKIKPGSENNQLSAFWDMLPTFAELLQQPSPEAIQGISILPGLLGEHSDERHESLYWEFHSRNPSQAVVIDDWKAIRHFSKVKGRKELVAGKTALYHLVDDPEETMDLADSHPQLTAQAEAIMAQRQSAPHAPWNF